MGQTDPPQGQLLVHNCARKAVKKLVLSLFICSAAAMHRSGDGPWHLKCG